MLHSCSLSRNLFLSRRFLPIFIVQFLGALNDNLFRNAIFVLVTFRLADAHGYNAPEIVSLGAGLFILPFFLFSAMAGAVADRYEKARLARQLKAIEIVLVLAAAFTLVETNVPMMLAVLFLLGIQASFFGPLKYSILPELVEPQELIAANAYVEGGTFMAILLGTIIGAITVTLDHGPLMIALSMGVMAFGGWGASYFIPQGQPHAPHLHVSWNFMSSIRPLVKEAMAPTSVRLSIFGISWFWFIGAVFLSILPNYVKDILQGDPTLVTFLLTLFSVGIASGSVLCTRLLRGRVEARYVPWGVAAMGISNLAVCAFSYGFGRAVRAPTILGFVTQWQGIAVAISLFCLAAAGGIFTVPLYSIMQARSDETHRARIIAANNIINSLFMVVSSIYTLLMFKCGFTVLDIFWPMAIISLFVAVYFKKRSI